MLNDSDCNVSDEVYVVSKKKMYKLRELQIVLHKYILYEIELQMPYEKLLQVLNIFIIPDLSAIIYDYIYEKIYIIVEAIEDGLCIHFWFNDKFYTFYVFGNLGVGILYHTCPEVYNILTTNMSLKENDRQLNQQKLYCRCGPTSTLHNEKQLKSCNLTTLNHKYDRMGDLNIMYTMFKRMIK